MRASRQGLTVGEMHTGGFSPPAAACAAARRRANRRIMLWASATHSSTARAFSVPRTSTRVRPMRRAAALAHSAWQRCLVQQGAALARHPLPPIRHPRPVIGPRRIGRGAVLVMDCRAPQLDAAPMRPFDVLVLGEAAIDEVVGRYDATCGELLQAAPGQAAIAAGGVDIDGEDDLAVRRRDD